MIPGEIRDTLRAEIGLQITKVASVAGGSINEAYELTTSSGSFFLKVNGRAPDDFFSKEVAGLKELRQTETDLIIPRVLAHRDPNPDRAGYLLLDYIPSGGKGDAEAFGAGLAHLHQQTQAQFGFSEDNYVGSIPQANTPMDDWISFFVQLRIEPLLKMAIDSGQADASLWKPWERLAGRLEALLPPCVPSLVHGDLWSGNYLYDTEGRAVLIDPAVYYGHPEMDLAFSRMFGGFAAGFYEGYAAVSPLAPGFEERVDIHNLYPLLVHVNLFGGHYASQLRSVLGRY